MNTYEKAMDRGSDKTTNNQTLLTENTLEK